MSLFEIVPFEERHLEEAAELFTAGYNILKKDVPFMPGKYGDKDVVLPSIRWITSNHPGVAAIENGRLIGYLSAILLPHFKGRDNGAYCPEWAHAAIDTNSRQIYRKMYEAIAADWLKNGCLNHAITILAHNKEALDTWFWNGFGLLVVDAVRTIDPIEVEKIENIKVRPASIKDLDALFPIMQEHSKYFPKAPLFLNVEEVKDNEEAKEWLYDPRVFLWIAEDESGILGFMKSEIDGESASMIVRDERTVSITGAYTKPEVRHRGLGKLLLKEIVNWASENDYARVSVDFEAANIYGGDFWMRHFKPVCYSMLRHVDDRLLKL